MLQLSQGATKLLQYIFKHKDDSFSTYFNASNICAKKAAGYTSVADVKPVLEELAEAKMIKESKKTFRSPKYMINPAKAEKIIQEEEDKVFAQEYRASVDEEIKKYKKFIVTTAVIGKEVNKPFLDSIKNYAKRNKALILLLPCEDVGSTSKRAASIIQLSPELKDLKVIIKNTFINKNLCLMALKVSAKQINPLSGLNRMPQKMDASLVIASPKIFLKYIPNMHFDIPPALMTTGAVTLNDYDNDRYMSKRTSTLAEYDHTYGAVIVEVEDDNIFHFRHVVASESGSLTDMGIEYLPDGSTRKMEHTAMVMGDSHTGYHDQELHLATMATASQLGVDKIVLHDVFNGTSITHHDTGKGITRAIKAGEGRLGLELECLALKNYLQDIEERGMEIFIPEANHNNFLYRYLESGNYIGDPMNYKISLKLASAAVEGLNPLQYAVEDLLGYKKDTIHWLEDDISRKIYGVEISAHGDRGANGSKGSLAVFENGLGNCVVAHTHSAAILRDAYCVGTVGLMNQGYNKGLSSWTRTCCLIYENGTKQLINFIPNKNGEYTCSA